MEIISLANKKIKETKALHRKKDRRRQGLFIVEGINMLGEILDNDYPYKDIFYTDRLLEINGGEEIFLKIRNRPNVYRVSPEVFASLTDTLTPQGILATTYIRERSLEEIDSLEATYIFLDRLQDPGNLGTIIRSADAFGIKGIIVNEGTVDPYNLKVVRSSMGSIFRVPIYYLAQNRELLDLKARGFRILATSLDKSWPLGEMDYGGKIIVIGNEASGVGEDIMELADDFIHIPMVGKSESLNAGVAASIIMYEALK